MPQPDRYRTLAVPYQGRHSGSLSLTCANQVGSLDFVTRVGLRQRLAATDEIGLTTTVPRKFKRALMGAYQTALR
jgi:hypothetical protein